MKATDALSRPLAGSASPRAWLALAVTLSILLAVNLPPWLPLQDFNGWAYDGYIGAQLLSHHLTDRFAFLPYPVPNSLIQALLSSLDLLFAPTVSARIVVNLYAVLAVATAWKLAGRACAPRPMPVFLVLLFSIYFNAAFWCGYMNFQFGMLIFSAWILCDAKTRSRPLVVLAFSLLAFFTHAIAWAAILLMMALDTLNDRKLLARVPALVSVGLFAWYVQSKAAPQGFRGMEHMGLIRTLGYKFYTFAKFGPYHNYLFSNAPHTGMARLAHLAGSAVNALCAVGLAWLVYAALRDAWRRRSADTATIATAVLFAAFLALPPIVADVINPGERMLCIVLLLCLVHALSARAISALSAGAAVLVLSAASLLWVDPAQWDQRIAIGLPASGFVDNLFWSRPAQFVAQARAAEAGQAPFPLSFHTSFLVDKEQGGHAR